MRNRKKGEDGAKGLDTTDSKSESNTTSLDLKGMDFAKLMEKVQTVHSCLLHSKSDLDPINSLLLVQAAPYISTIQAFCRATIPYVEMAHSKCVEAAEYAAPYRLDLLLPALIGTVLCFFGGTFVTLIAAVEAYRQLGYTESVNAINNITDDWRYTLPNLIDNNRFASFRLPLSSC